MKILLEIEEKKKLCCTEEERAKQLRIDELSRQEKESQSAMNQQTVQIQKVQDKVNEFLERFQKGFHDPATASSSGLSLYLQSPYEYSETSWNA